MTPGQEKPLVDPAVAKFAAGDFQAAEEEALKLVEVKDRPENVLTDRGERKGAYS